MKAFMYRRMMVVVAQRERKAELTSTRIVGIKMKIKVVVAYSG